MPRAITAAVVTIICSMLVRAAPVAAAPPSLDDRPAGPGEWGYRPLEVRPSEVDPPNFVWRPQKSAASYELQCARDDSFSQVVLGASPIPYACYTAPKPLGEGQYFWRYRFVDGSGQPSQWSSVRRFAIAAGAVVFPMPPRDELLGRIPNGHPRLFVRPEGLGPLRQLARGDLRGQYEMMVADCERLLRSPPDTSDPPKYPPGTKVKSEAWRAIWWGNRERTIKALNAAATLGFVRLLDGNPKYGAEAKRILLEVANWDPRGATNYHYNDEAGMPYVYYFARAYTFVNDLLTEDEKVKCRQVIRLRGNEMYKHLNPRHLWKPYASHSNRAWHKLGEAGIAFLDEIPEARDWAWFAMNVFYNVYPVWSDADGGWHEGVAYWNSYISRFTYFADVMRVAMDLDAYSKPYFSRAGYYAMYLQPPGTPGGGFGDLVAQRPASGNRALMTALAAQARNPHWQWYVQAIGGPSPEPGYIGFVRGSMPGVDAKAPDDLRTSRAFHGIGQAFLNTNLSDASDNVQFGFKSSPFGTQSHGYDANNSFFLYAYGQRLFAPTGRRDIYGSDHHTDWMWETKSTNSITVNGRGQTPRHSAASQGRIIAFETSKDIDYVAGDASGAYGQAVKHFERHVLFLKPSLLIIYDRLESPQSSTFEWRLHSPVKMTVAGQDDIRVASAPAAARVAMLAPPGLDVSVTDQYDVPPRSRIKVREWHLTAKTPSTSKVQFVTAIRIHRSGEPELPIPALTTAGGEHIINATAGGHDLTIVISIDHHNQTRIRCRRRAPDGMIIQRDIPSRGSR